ncbi:hypothetical protein Taro_036998 [Colocasia esculenta]|uniref:Uncharacterized protein n=1 Tax=Colocasia esculenta TaxID=4460 RepID=A0A843WJF6_COLES|nr:hypothetical protein [Colocasia esculenta]
MASCGPGAGHGVPIPLMPTITYDPWALDGVIKVRRTVRIDRIAFSVRRYISYRTVPLRYECSVALIVLGRAMGDSLVMGVSSSHVPLSFLQMPLSSGHILHHSSAPASLNTQRRKNGRERKGKKKEEKERENKKEKVGWRTTWAICTWHNFI